MKQSVVAQNSAARRAYRTCGLREDGVLREGLWYEGQWYDQILMSILEVEFRELLQERDASR